MANEFTERELHLLRTSLGLTIEQVDKAARDSAKVACIISPAFVELSAEYRAVLAKLKRS